MRFATIIAAAIAAAALPAAAQTVNLDSSCSGVITAAGTNNPTSSGANSFLQPALQITAVGGSTAYLSFSGNTASNGQVQESPVQYELTPGSTRTVRLGVLPMGQGTSPETAAATFWSRLRISCGPRLPVMPPRQLPGN